MIERLTANDFEEAVDLMNLVFSQAYGPQDFPTFLPELYQRTDASMACLYGMREAGRLVAVVGLYHRDWQPGGIALPIMGIGGVCCHPRHGGRGHVSTMMRQAMADIDAAGYALSYLSGQRQRYGYYGYEIAGQSTTYTLTDANIKHAFAGVPQVALESREDDATDFALLAAWRARLQLACRVSAEGLPLRLRNWGASLLVGSSGGADVGYLSLSKDGSTVHEVVAEDTEQALGMLRTAALQAPHRRLSIMQKGITRALAMRLQQLAESAATSPSGNWRIHDWPQTLSVLLEVRCRETTIPDGRACLQVGDGVTLVLEVRGGEPFPVKTCSGPPDLVLSASDATRLLFGPLRPSDQRDLPLATRMLDAWCPLPLALLRADSC